ncbi:hypothetical protein [Nocardia pseudobrasiliensis]|uniref:DUF998 domain-containing protein n=1 Tax=Nocardia pseudobrasiliensis TaxID=45979 RepID=A0A370I046_9NOCA|nr:hypothetical protein [Nocardia pseudobrasiliensis]RDI64127.1 hypothetical protein DFR76_109469 [Nocardia pseudobrasiliensis]
MRTVFATRLATVTGWSWAATLLYLPTVAIVAAGWPRPYRVTVNHVGDLGATSCAPLADIGGAYRYVCSPWHLSWMLATVALGALTASGALAWSVRATQPLQRAGGILLTVAAVAMVIGALTPVNVDPATHDAAEVLRWAAQLLGMVFLAVALPHRAIRVWTGVCAGISAIGGWALYSAPALGLGAGLEERIAFDTLVLWTGVTGLLMLRGTLDRPARPAAIGHRAAAHTRG